MLKIIHLADVHLEKFLSKEKFPLDIIRERRREVYRNLERVLMGEDADLFLIAGDLFESQYMGPSQTMVLEDILNRSGKEIVICPGNHDPSYSYEGLNLVSNIKVFKKDNLRYFEYPQLRTRVYGLAWEKSFYKPRELKVDLDENFYNVLMVHGDLDNQSTYMPFSSKNLLRLGFDYIALGHIHKPQKLGSRMAYPGSFDPYSFKDLGPRGYLKILLKDQEISLDFIEGSSRSFINKDLELRPNLSPQIFLENLRLMGDDKNFYRINLKGRISQELYQSMETILDIASESFYYVEFNKLYSLDMDLSLDPMIRRLFSIIDSQDAKPHVKAKAKEKILNMGVNP